MALEAVGELLEVVGRFLFRILNEALIEFLCKGTGYFICKPFKPTVDPDGFFVFLIGFVFWLAVVLLGFQAYEFIQIDSCLDAGGRFDDQLQQCSNE